MTLDTARALPKGKHAPLVAVGVDVHRGARHKYTEPAPDPQPGQPPAENEEEELPDWPASPQLAFGARHGLGGGVQAEWLVFSIFGAAAGLKWQVLGGADGPVALSLGGRLSAWGFGDGARDTSGSLSELSAQTNLNLSVFPHERVALYVAPRALVTRLGVSRTKDGIERSTHSDRTAWGGALGARLRIRDELALVFEGSLLRFVEHRGERSLMVTGGLGFTF